MSLIIKHIPLFSFHCNSYFVVFFATGSATWLKVKSENFKIITIKTTKNNSKEFLYFISQRCWIIESQKFKRFLSKLLFVSYKLALSLFFLYLVFLV